jgi:hypothetical protein
MKISKLSLATAIVFVNTSVVAKTSKTSKKGTEDVSLTLLLLCNNSSIASPTDLLGAP